MTDEEKRILKEMYTAQKYDDYRGTILEGEELEALDNLYNKIITALNK